MIEATEPDRVKDEELQFCGDCRKASVTRPVRNPKSLAASDSKSILLRWERGGRAPNVATGLPHPSDSDRFQLPRERVLKRTRSRPKSHLPFHSKAALIPDLDRVRYFQTNAKLEI